MKSERFIIDIGANSGDFIVPIAKLNPEHKALAFEPNKELFLKLEAMKIENLEVIEGGVGVRQEKLLLNISEKGDKGTSSLLSFSKDIKNDPYWRDRDDLSFDRQEEIEVDTLRGWLEGYEIESIDFIKIDTQGFDLIALESLGSELLAKVRYGMLEVPATELNHLYEGDESDLTSALSSLKEKNFSIFKIEPNDEGFKEYNVYFFQKGEDPLSIEDELKLSSNKVYNGNIGVMLERYGNSYENRMRCYLGNIKRSILGSKKI